MVDAPLGTSEDPENPDGIARLADLSGPMIDRQLGKIEALNSRLTMLSRTSLLLLGIVISGLGIAGPELLTSLGNLSQLLLSLSALFLLSAAFIGFMTTDPAAGFGESDALYRKVIDEERSEEQVNWNVAVISGSHIGRNQATIATLAKKITLVQILLGFGTSLLLATSLFVAFRERPLIVVTILFEAIVVGTYLYRWLKGKQEEREKLATEMFPEFRDSA